MVQGRVQSSKWFGWGSGLAVRVTVMAKAVGVTVMAKAVGMGTI